MIYNEYAIGKSVMNSIFILRKCSMVFRLHLLNQDLTKTFLIKTLVNIVSKDKIIIVQFNYIKMKPLEKTNIIKN